MSGRKIVVRVGRTLSGSVALEEGIPQGSVLSCTLFMLAMNSVTDKIPRNVKSLLYVDDLTIYASGPTQRCIERRLQGAIEGLKSWTRATGFSFSPAKTVAMHICRKRNCPKLAPNLSIDNNNIRTVDSQRFLGVIFDNSMTWKPHIKQLKTSCNKTLNIMKYLSHKKWGADRVTLLRLYTALIRSKLDYGSEVYSSACNSLLDSLEPIQNAAIRLATGAFRSSPVASLQAESGINPLGNRRQIQTLNTYIRTLSNPRHPMFENFTTDEPEDIFLMRRSPKSFISRARQLVDDYGIDTSNMLIEDGHASPPWTLFPNLKTCTDLFHVKKNSRSPVELRGIFSDHYRSHNIGTSIFTDGSKDNIGVGYACVAADRIIYKSVLSIASVFTAELMAIREAITHGMSQNWHSFTVITDSRSSVQAINKYNSNNVIVQTIQDMIIDNNLKLELCWVPSHVGVPMNEAADVGARQASKRPPTITMIPRNDLKSQIRKISLSKWKNGWQAVDNNKLRTVMEELTPLTNCSCSNREWERALCRMRIGHSHITHGFLMEKKQAPYCEDCIVPLTMAHILAECPNYIAQRQLYLRNYPSIKAILTGTASDYGGPLYKFVSSIGLLNKL